MAADSGGACPPHRNGHGDGGARLVPDDAEQDRQVALERLRALEAQRRKLAAELEEHTALRAALLSLHEPSAGEVQRRVKLKVPGGPPEGVELQVAQDPRLAHGGLLWPSGVALAEYVPGVGLHSGSRVLELGCGAAALPSLVAAALGAQVLATDFEAVLPLAAGACARNAAVVGSALYWSGHKTGAEVRFATYSWSESDPPPDGPYDLVLGADLLYHEAVHAALAAAIASALGGEEARGSALLSYESRDVDAEARFFAKAASLGAGPPLEVDRRAAAEGRGPIRIVELKFGRHPTGSPPELAAVPADLGLYL